MDQSEAAAWTGQDSGCKKEAAHSNIWPYLAVLGAVCLWGGSFVSGKIAVSALGVWSLMWARLTLSVICLLPFYRVIRPRRYRKGDWKQLLVLVALQPIIYFLFETNALRFTTSSQAAVICSLIPLLTCVGARFFFKEQISNTAWIGLVVSLCGVAWLTFSGAPSLNASNPMLGNSLEFLAAFAAAGYILLVQKLGRRYSSWTLTGAQALAGAVFFLPGAPKVISGMGDWDLTLAVSVFYLGSGAFLGAFLLYNWAISRVSAAKVSPFTNLVPVVAVIMGWLLLDETLSTIQIMAAVVVIGGVFLCQLRRRG